MIGENEYITVQAGGRLLLTTLIKRYLPGTKFKVFLNSKPVSNPVPVAWTEIEFHTPESVELPSGKIYNASTEMSEDEISLRTGKSRKATQDESGLEEGEIVELSKEFTHLSPTYSLWRKTKETFHPKSEFQPKRSLKLPINPVPYHKRGSREDL